MQKIILFYKFTPVEDTDDVRKWQTMLCATSGLTGRIIISEHGINGTLGGDIEAIEHYIEEMDKSDQVAKNRSDQANEYLINTYPNFSDIEYKWGEGGWADFPKLSVKVRKELVTLAPEETFDVYNASTALRPKQWHEYLEKNPDVTILDARNNYESKVGVFKGKNLIAPDINRFAEIKKTLQQLPKDKPVLTYCTGDIRCEYLSAYMKHTGFDEVYHLDGGIVKYGEEFGDDGFWEGKCYVFDNRTVVEFSDGSRDIAECNFCKTATSTYRNCANQYCNKRMLLCVACMEKRHCSACELTHA